MTLIPASLQMVLYTVSEFTATRCKVMGALESGSSSTDCTVSTAALAGGDSALAAFCRSSR